MIPAAIRIPVNPANPGQFLACCGLLELAYRSSKGEVEGWFDSRFFCIGTCRPVADLLKMLAHQDAEILETLEGGFIVEKAIAPLRIALKSESLEGEAQPWVVLDGWTRMAMEKGKPKLVSDSAWKFWSGQQTAVAIWSSLRKALHEQLAGGQPRQECFFTDRVAMTGRFGFDPQSAWNTLDTGYSPNDQGIPVATSPALELLALVGLQRFRPSMVGRFEFEYCTWGHPLACAAASAAASGAAPVHPSKRYRASITRRGKYGGLTYSSITSGDLA